MRWLLIVALSACTGSDAGSDSDALDPRRDGTTWPTEIGTADRPAKVTTPARYDGVSDLPLIVVLHGYGASGPVQDAYFQLSNRATEGGYVVIVPDGTTDESGKKFWNATDVCCDFGATEVDDVGYVLGLIDQVEASIPIDPKRITLVGHSNGGFMSHRLACDASERIAGIASLAGVTFDDADDCAATAPVSVLQIHGNSDSTIDYEGGVLSTGGQSYPSAEASTEYWADIAGCDGSEAAGTLDYVRTLEGVDTAKKRWTGCGDTSVELWTIDRGDHVPIFNDAFQADLLAWLLDQERP